MPRSPGCDPDPRVAALARLLCRYWRRNPLACDTPEGIAQWWLPDGHGATASEVRAALEDLNARELVEKVVGADGRTHFRLRGEVAARPQLLDLDANARGRDLH